MKKEYILLCKKSNGNFIKGRKYNSTFDGYNLYIELSEGKQTLISMSRYNDENLKYIEEHFTTVNTHRKNIIDSIE